MSDSTNQLPASGSGVSVTPASWAMICWVRRASRAASAVGQGERLVPGVRVQALGPAEHGREGLERGPDDVVVDRLGRQR